jgi:hypothetical protein
MTNPLDVLPANAAGTLVAIACVIAGGPCFADGLRALRARRALAALRRAPGGALEPGLVCVKGRVALDSPLFAPLSTAPCAGFVVDVHLPDGSLAGRVHEVRGFRLETASGIAVIGAGASWEPGVTAERTVESFSELSANLAALLRRTPELAWLEGRTGALRVVERALPASREAFVLGTAERLVFEQAEPVRLLRTGTDDVEFAVAGDAVATPEWRIGADGPLERCIVSDRAPQPERYAPPAWRVAGALLGPVLTLAGLVALARATGPLLGRGF